MPKNAPIGADYPRIQSVPDSVLRFAALRSLVCASLLDPARDRGRPGRGAVGLARNTGARQGAFASEQEVVDLVIYVMPSIKRHAEHLSRKTSDYETEGHETGLKRPCSAGNRSVQKW